ncbi:MAG: DNA repair protein RecN [Pyrinomonadaceae bacterium]
MLKQIEISNFVLIPKLEVSFHEGMSILTGETGSGKSIIIDALGLLLGDRASTEIIRDPDKTTVIEGRFLPSIQSTSIRKSLKEIATESGVELGDHPELIVRREFSANGRNRIFINDCLTNLATLKLLQPFLVEIHGQGDQRSLLSTLAQLNLLDSYADCLNLRSEVELEYRRRIAMLQKIGALEQEISVRERIESDLQFQLKELIELNIRSDEEEELKTERELVTNSDRLIQLKSALYNELYEDDESLITKMISIRRNLQSLASVDDRMSGLLETESMVAVGIEEMADVLRSYGSDLDFAPGRLDEIEGRLAALERLKRKHGKTSDELIMFREEIEARLEGLGNLADRLQTLKTELIAVEAHYSELAKTLTAKRKEAAIKFEKSIKSELSQVAMPGAHFKIQIHTFEEVSLSTKKSTAKVNDLPDESAGGTDANSFFTSRGADHITFMFTANDGEELRPLARVASGGELSRVMLALRVICADVKESVGAETLIFDEIDAGIGGRASESVGRRLKALAKNKQVLCITHQAQIARFADHHYVVLKKSQDGRTVSRLVELEWQERVKELGRMIGAEGESTTDAAARWMLESAQSLAKPERKSPRRMQSKT